MSPTPPATLIATIGTRDLMYQTQGGDWYNVGNDQMRQDILTDQAEVLSDLGLDVRSFRDLTRLLWEQHDRYRDRLRPVILGQLFQAQAPSIRQVYLIGTDQAETVAQRNKDTLYACYLIQAWLRQQFPHLAPEGKVTVVPLGRDGTNPSDFDAMFRWWQRHWPQMVTATGEDPVWLCNKGGVGQASEAGRISGLSRYGDLIQFFEFTETRSQNLQGQPSAYSGPFSGTVYLWDRTRQQALQFLDRFDYGGAEAVLAPYLRQDTRGFGAVPTWLRAGMAWQQGQFDTFAQLAKATLPPGQTLGWGWRAYEQAYLAWVRLSQGYTTEAMLLSFRAVEGLMWEWVEAHYGDYLFYPEKRYPQLSRRICDRFAGLASHFEDRHTGAMKDSTNINGYVQRSLLEAAQPAFRSNADLQAFWRDENRTQRNALSHRLGGLSERELCRAWGADITTVQDWEGRLLGCVNTLAGQRFTTLKAASALAALHQRLMDKVGAYQV
jgi:hypothetical protein